MPDILTWRGRLDASLAEADRDTQFVQLATIRPNAGPAVRTVVFRAFLEPGSRPAFGTDLRSAKVEQIATQPAAEACWYFSATREQYRLMGRLALVWPNTGGELGRARAQVWNNLSEAARQVYSWPPPGEPLADADEFALPAPADPPDHFGLLVLTPERVDYLNVRVKPHQRILYRQSGEGWIAHPINP